MIDRLFAWLQEFLNYRMNILFAIGSLLYSYFAVFKFVYRGSKKHFHTIKAILLFCAIVLFGLIIPLLILRHAYWSGTWNLVLNIVAIAGILFLVFLLVIIYQMNAFTGRPEILFDNRQQASIALRATKPFFGGSLHIHLTDQEWSGKPLAHHISAKIWSPGYDPVIVKRKTIGDAVNYAGQWKYHIRIIAASINEATFEVVRVGS